MQSVSNLYHNGWVTNFYLRMPAKKTVKKTASKKVAVKKTLKTNPLSIADNKYLVMVLMVCALIPLAMIMQVFFSNFRTIQRNMPEVFVGEESGVNRVFVTSTRYDGNLGGLAGADTKCQDIANAKGMGGTWKAWLSDSKTSASSRLIHSNNPYVLLDGSIVANNWTDLTDGTLQTPINMDENGYQTINEMAVWTSTKVDGSTYSPYANNTLCNDYTVADENYSMCGMGYVNNNEWTDWSSDWCKGTNRLYCFEQIGNPPTPTPSPTPVVCSKGMAYPHYKNVKGVCTRIDECGRTTCDPLRTPKPTKSAVVRPTKLPVATVNPIIPLPTQNPY